jgi:O-antigen/teichoic acid export membrane protein
MVFTKIKSLKNHQGFMKYFKNTSWLFAEKILRMAVGLFVGIWIARYLGPEQFGLFSYTMSFVGLFTAIAALGLDGIVVRELVKDESKRDKLIGTAFFLKLIGAIFTLILLFIATQFTSNDTLTNALIFIIASSVIFQSFNVVDFYFQAKVLSKFVVFANIISLFVSSIVKIALILNEAPLVYFAYAVLFESVILALGFIYFYSRQKELKFANWRFDKNIAKSLLKDSWPLIFGILGAAVYMKIDQVMIKEMLGNEQVGYYAIAVQITSAWFFITTVITSSLFPALINYKKTNEKLYLNRLQEIYNILLKISFLISILIFIYSQELIIFLFGNEYSNSIEIVDIYIWSIVFIYLSNGSWGYYLNENLQYIASLRLIYGSILNIFLNLYFIDYFGVIGATYSTIISYSFSSYFINLFFEKTQKNFQLQTNAFLNIINIKTWINPIKL